MDGRSASIPVAGVTPYKNMRRELQRPVRPDSFPGAKQLASFSPRTRRRVASTPSPKALPWFSSRPKTALSALRRFAKQMQDRAPYSSSQPIAASTPLLLSGFDDEVVNIVSKELRPFNLLTLQAGGGQSTRSADRTRRYVNGGAIGVQLVRGDINMTGVGTVTQVEGRRLVAFGHPMLNAGEVGLPTATARVLHILASQNRSFKMAEALAPLGTMIHDRQAAIVVDTKVQAQTVPVRVKLRGVDGAPRSEWSFDVASHRLLTPMLVFAGLVNAIRATASDQTEVMVEATTTVGIENHGDLVFTDKVFMGAGLGDPFSLSRLRGFEAMQTALNNPFQREALTRVEVDVAVRFDRDVATIVDVSVPTTEVEPGSTVNLHVVTQRYGQGDSTRIVPLEIPMSAAGRPLDVLVQPGNQVKLEQPLPRDLAGLLQGITQRLPSTDLVVSARMPSRGLRFRGHLVRSLPGSALDSLQLTSDSSRALPFATYERKTVDMGATVIVGTAKLRLEVRDAPKGR